MRHAQLYEWRFTDGDARGITSERPVAKVNPRTAMDVARAYAKEYWCNVLIVYPSGIRVLWRCA